MKLRYFSHSSFQITTDSGLVLLIDPFLDDNPTAPVSSAELTADFIVLTHAHGDHVGDAARFRVVDRPAAERRETGAEDHAGVEQVWVDSETLEGSEISEQRLKEIFADCHGILVPGGFGDRGIQGKVNAVRFARENKIPFFGICLGLQCAMIEIGRNLVGLEMAHSAEFAADTPHPPPSTHCSGPAPAGGGSRGCRARGRRRYDLGRRRRQRPARPWAPRLAPAPDDHQPPARRPGA